MDCTMATVQTTNLLNLRANLSASQWKGSAGPPHAAWVLPASLHSLQGTPLGRSEHVATKVTAMVGGSPPRYCTLREFGDGVDESQLMLRPIRVRASDGRGEAPQATVLELIAANAEASAQVSSFETVAGRAAMMAFLMATLDESLTGTSLFQDFNPDALVPFLLLLAGVCATAGSAAWLGRHQIMLQAS